MLATFCSRAIAATSRSMKIKVISTTMRFLSDKPLTPNLPGLSDDQIQKIYVTDTSLRSRHIQIEGDMTDEERDIARVSETDPIETEI
jgi:hypothetical protein